MILQYVYNTDIQYFIWVLQHTLGRREPSHLPVPITELSKYVGSAKIKTNKGSNSLWICNQVSYWITVLVWNHQLTTLMRCFTTIFPKFGWRGVYKSFQQRTFGIRCISRNLNLKKRTKDYKNDLVIISWIHK